MKLLRGRWRGRGGVVLLRRRQSTNKGDEGHARTFPEGGGRQWSSSSGKGTQQSNTKAASMARNVVAMTARATSKAERAMVAGATRMMAATAATAAMMTPNDCKDNEDSNSKNNNKAMTTPIATIPSPVPFFGGLNSQLIPRPIRPIITTGHEILLRCPSCRFGNRPCLCREHKGLLQAPRHRFHALS